MYVTQNIITELIKQIDTAMAAVNVNVHGNGIAVKDTAGQVVTLNVTQNGTRNYVGISDTQRTGYYIRTNGIVSETRKAANTKRGSCGIELDVRVPLKLVFWHVCADPRMLLDSVKFALYGANFKGVQWQYAIVNPRLFPVSNEVLPWTVYAAETGKDPKTLLSLMQIVSLDFELRYDFSLTEKCKPFAICEVINKPQPVPIIGLRPVNTIAPVISGNAIVNAKIDVIDNGTWLGDLPITYTYQWKRNGIDIIGQTNSQYLTVLEDLGKKITCVVTATNIVGSASAISNSITIL
jgi:hypothetical protein